jgi:hypothetical protein
VVVACADHKADLEVEAELAGNTMTAERIVFEAAAGQLSLVLVLLGMFVGLACGGELTPPPPPEPCFARVAAGPDGWCDYDGTTCACHGHGAGDLCAEAVAEFEKACP